MAIDSANKRFSIMLEPGLMPYPPDGTLGTADRIDMLEFYSGIAADEPVVIVAANPWLKGISERNWEWNRLPVSNWEIGVSERNWRRP